MSLETIKVSEQAKSQLSRAKRHTKIKNWNVLCRWALCLSLAEESKPNPAKIVTDSSVEMTWKVFGGVDADLYMALMRQRCFEDGFGTEDDVVPLQDSLDVLPIANEPIELFQIEGADHVFDGASTQVMCQKIVEWLAD